MNRIRILTDYTEMPVYVDRVTKAVIVDWYGREVEIGRAFFSAENDTWMLEQEWEADLRHKAPEGLHNLSDVLDDGLGDEIDNAINQTMTSHYVPKEGGTYG